MAGGDYIAHLDTRASQLRPHTLHSFCILITSVVSPRALKFDVKVNRHRNSINSQKPKSEASSGFWLALTLLLA